MENPRCCGERMALSIDTGRFIELFCRICSDVVYLKKNAIEKPQMLDD